jgi:dihydrodipicolinate synthase/N-acetylneuraminate lyase
MHWKGVMPAITTCFNNHSDVDFSFLADHCRWLVENGCSGVVALGSLGEGATLYFEEKQAILELCVQALRGTAPVVASISALSTTEAISLAKAAAKCGCDGLMILPPYVYKGDWREMKAHVSAVLNATNLSCLLHNNPIAYGTDFLPEQIVELAAEHKNLHAVKESSADIRRVTEMRALLGNSLEILVGVDNAILEGIGMGASGWIAGLANAFPRESVDLFEHGLRGEKEKAFELYNWFLPLLRLDTVPKFVQLIKQAQEEMGVGSARVREPRLALVGEELEGVKALVREAMKNKPSRSSSPLSQVS